jgi:probable F420-dependent oxidoreductase
VTPVKFSLFLPTRRFDVARDAALRAEQDGYYSVSINDHFVAQTGKPDAPQLECFTTLTGIAALTSAIRLTPSVASINYRNPSMLARICATLDQVSNGRLVLGLGAGWQRSEYEANGYDFPSAAERLARLAEGIEVIKLLWSTGPASYAGEHYTLVEAVGTPEPVQSPGPPIMVGGSSDTLLDIAAREADIANIIPPTSYGKDFLKDGGAVQRFTMDRLVERIGVLRDLSESYGRPRDSVEVGGLVIVHATRTPADEESQRLAHRLGLPDAEAARRSPVSLVGTPEQLIEELSYRAVEVGATYYVCVHASERSERIFTNEVMPAFASGPG